LKKINELSIFKKEENYKMYASFNHIFAGWYSAGYYSYMWADIIVDEIWGEFKKNWVFDKKTAQKFEEKILWAGSIKKASEMFEDFMGRWVSIDAFLEEKGLK
jgi:Zn-dependent oligopeptidase